ncbi:uncharacterized protein LOC126285062 [Schistocerca gregaria]|uniref:uncharacterized protein LOC126285062 n=1 Tax=Schistocerca gregaria TaxID=7010 RepID=UPI00211DE117|nr:uncharacterized protein LOC126285062 [Schistocerca gregaria]
MSPSQPKRQAMEEEATAAATPLPQDVHRRLSDPTIQFTQENINQAIDQTLQDRFELGSSEIREISGPGPVALPGDPRPSSVGPGSGEKPNGDNDAVLAARTPGSAVTAAPATVGKSTKLSTKARDAPYSHASRKPAHPSSLTDSESTESRAPDRKKPSTDRQDPVPPQDASATHSATDSSLVDMADAYEITVPTSNRFEGLTDVTPADKDSSDNPPAPTSVKAPKVPSIIVHDTINYLDRVVVRHLEPTTPTADVKEALGFTVQSVTVMHQQVPDALVDESPVKIAVVVVIVVVRLLKTSSSHSSSMDHPPPLPSSIASSDSDNLVSDSATSSISSVGEGHSTSLASAQRRGKNRPYVPTVGGNHPASFRGCPGSLKIIQAWKRQRESAPKRQEPPPRAPLRNYNPPPAPPMEEVNPPPSPTPTRAETTSSPNPAQPQQATLSTKRTPPPQVVSPPQTSPLPTPTQPETERAEKTPLPPSSKATDVQPPRVIPAKATPTETAQATSAAADTNNTTNIISGQTTAQGSSVQVEQEQPLQFL